MRTKIFKARTHPNRGLAGGFSLIELMVAVTLGLVLILALASLLAQQSRSRAELDKSAAQVENGRYALSILQSDIQLAGFYGQFADSIASAGIAAERLRNGQHDQHQRVARPAPAGLQRRGIHDAGDPSGCLSADNHVDGTDILVIRRLGTGVASTFDAKRVYVQTTPAVG